MKTVLFVCYGGGHVRMVLPVARALAALGLARPVVLGLTTAADVVRQAGLPLLQFKDFVRPGDSDDKTAVAHGHELVRQLTGDVADPDESAAYLGLSHADLVVEHGEMEAARRHAQLGRQAYLPVRTLRRILQQMRPELLVATNSPRGERAAVLAAGSLGIPAICIVDLFAIDEVQWIGQPGYADRICVLNPAVKERLVQAGRQPHEIIVTGNPAFDTLFDPAIRRQGLALREARGWAGKKVVLWPNQTEPAVHPFDGRPGDPGLPERALQALRAFVMARDDTVLCVRPRPGETLPAWPGHPRIVLTGQDWPLAPLLHATDLVVTLNSTVGLEGHLTGARVLQILGSVFDHAMPMLAYGMADEEVSLDHFEAAWARCLALPRRCLNDLPLATERVVDVLRAFLDPRP